MMESSSQNLAQVDTHPGATGPFAPPADWDGDAVAYLQLMRQRYRHPGIAQQMVVTARMYRGESRSEQVELEGPWAEEAQKILRSV